MTDDAPDARAVLSPSDVAARRGPGVVRLGGRVATCSGTTLVVADALRAVTVRLREPADLAPGELVIVRGRLRRGSVEGAHVVTRLPGKPPNAGTEHARFALSGVAAHLVARSHALRVVRAWFDRQGFVEVETPLRVPTPGLDAHVHAIGAEGGHLITSPELHMKRLVVGGLPRVYQLARTSRRDEQGALHEPEFTMLEWYRAFSGMNAMIADTEAVVSSVVRALTGQTRVIVGKRRVDVRPPFPRLTVRAAFRKFAGVSDAVELAERNEDEFFQVFVDRVEPGLSRCRRPVVLTEFPAVQAALARRCPHDPRVAERFEVYVAGIELCNGFGELTDETEQHERFELERARRQKAGEPVYALPERFLAALGEGLPPSGGNALGFDRLVAVALSAESIQDVIAFPETLK